MRSRSTETDLRFRLAGGLTNVTAGVTIVRCSQFYGTSLRGTRRARRRVALNATKSRQPQGRASMAASAALTDRTATATAPRSSPTPSSTCLAQRPLAHRADEAAAAA